MNLPLFNRIGGDATVEAAVNRFYDKFLLQRPIYRFFEGVDMAMQKEKLRKFFVLVLGGNSNVSIEKLKIVHQPLVKKGLNRAHIDLWLNLMQETLLELHIPEELVSEFMETCQPFKKAIENAC